MASRVESTTPPQKMSCHSPGPEGLLSGRSFAAQGSSTWRCRDWAARFFNLLLETEGAGVHPGLGQTYTLQAVQMPCRETVTQTMF